MGRRMLAGAVAAAIVAALASTSSALAASGRVGILSPSPDAVSTGPAVIVSVRAPAHLLQLRVSLDRAPVLMRRSADGLYRGRVAAGRLAPGVHGVSVRVREADGRTGFDHVSFIRGRFTPGLLAAAGGRSPFAVNLAIQGIPRVFVATLNGRPLDDPLNADDEPAPFTLSASYGLHFGRNRLVALIAREDGAYVRVVRTVDVPRTAPLAGAGCDLTGVVRQRLRLDGSASRSSRPGGALRFSWRIVLAPARSRARLSGPDGATPSFRPDKVGHYRILLLLREIRSGARTLTTRAFVNITATETALPIGIPVNTWASTSNGAAVQIGTQSYSIPPTGGVLLVNVARDTGSVIGTQTFPSAPGQGAIAQSFVNGPSTKPITIVVSNRAEVSGSDWAALFKELGLPKIDSGTGGSAQAFTAVGTRNKGVGIASTQSSNDPASLSIRGYVQYQTVLGQGYDFVQGQYVTYNTHAAGSDQYTNVIRIGSRSYTGFRPGAFNGLHVVLVKATDLSLVSNQTFTTEDGGGFGSQGALMMIAFLQQERKSVSMPGAPPLLLFVQSIRPGALPRNDVVNNLYPAPALVQLGAELKQWGANVSAFTQPVANNQIGLPVTKDSPTPQDFAFVGSQFQPTDGSGATVLTPAAQAPMAVSNLPGTGGGSSLAGTLGKLPPYADYEAVSGAAGLNKLRNLAAIAYQPPEAWPYHPINTGQTPPPPTAGELKAYQYISGVSLPGNYTYSTPRDCYIPADEQQDIRATYCDQGVTYFIPSKETNPPTNLGFTAQQYFGVLNEIIDEVANVNRFRKIAGKLKTYLLLKANDSPVAISAVIQTIDNSLSPPPMPASTASFWTALGAAFTDLAADTIVSIEYDVSAGLTYVAAIGTLTSELLSGPGGNPPQTVNFDAQELTDLAVNRYKDYAAGIAQIENIVVSDYGKLSSFANETVPPGTALDQSLALASSQWVWTQLLPLAYQPRFAATPANIEGRPSQYHFTYDAGVQSAQDWKCVLPSYQENITDKPFLGPPYRNPAMAQFPSGDWLYLVNTLHYPNGGNNYFPDKTVLNDLLMPADKNTFTPTHMGFSKQDLFWRLSNFNPYKPPIMPWWCPLADQGPGPNATPPYPPVGG